MKPIRVLVRLKNNRLVRLREDLGMGSVAFSRAVGISASYYCALENFKISPFNAEAGEWRPSAEKIAVYHGVSPEFIWPDEVRSLRDVALLKLEASPDELARQPLLASEAMEARQLSEALDRSIKVLSHRQFMVVGRTVIEGRPLHEADPEGTSSERARQIQIGALRKIADSLRHEELAEETRRCLAVARRKRSA